MPIKEALLLEKSKFNKIVEQFMAYTSYCGSMLLPEKMSEWCDYLQCDGTTCKNAQAIPVLETPKIPKIVSAHCNTNSSRDPILEFNGTCFDQFFCTPDWASKDYHYVLGIFCMTLAAFSLIFSIIYITGFLKEYGKKETRTQLLVVQSMCDMFYILVTLISTLSIYSYHSNLVDQVRLYSSTNIFAVLYLLPFGVLFESLSIWVWILLIFDRFNFLSHGTHSKNLLTTKVCTFLLGMIFVSLLGLSLLKPIMFELEKLPIPTHNYRLIYSQVGSKETYQDLVRFWLKMPFECLLPLTTIFIIIIMVIHKLIFASAENSKTSYYDFQEHRLTKSILSICCLLLIAKVPKMALHIMKYETGIEFNAEIKLYMYCQCFDALYYWIKSCFIYQYMCPLFSRNLQNVLCCEKEYGIDEKFKTNYPIECDNYSKDLLFENHCKKFLYQVASIDKETIV